MTGQKGSGSWSAFITEMKFPSRYLAHTLSTRMMIRTFTLALSLAMCFTATAVADDDSVNFSRDILPLLSNSCFTCHGPDEANRQSELRLDKHESALMKQASGRAALVPGHSAQSELFRRIASSDADVQMPPPDSDRKLTDAQTLC